MQVNGQLHAPAALLQGKIPNTHWILGSAGPKTALDVWEKREICTNSNPSSSTS
jgi:hypothetical protein